MFFDADDDAGFVLSFNRQGHYDLRIDRSKIFQLTDHPAIYSAIPIAKMKHSGLPGIVIAEGRVNISHENGDEILTFSSEDRVFDGRSFIVAEDVHGNSILQRHNAKVVQGVAQLFFAKETEQRIVAAAVLIPGVADFHGTIYDGETVRAAAYYFMENYLVDNAHGINIMHKEKRIENAIKVLQSYVTDKKMSFSIDVEPTAEEHLSRRRTKVTYPKDTWLLWARILHDGLWDDIKNGKFTGWSPEGWGKLEPLK